MTTTNPLMARFAGEPTLVSETAADRFNACLAQATAHPDFAKIGEFVASEDFWPQPDDRWGCRVRPYNVVDSVLQIPVKGVLLNGFPFALGDWATGYEYIWEAFKRGCGDYATGVIKGIAFLSDTPGGMVAGCFDAVDKMVALKEKIGVPVRAFAHESAYSAGYAIATVADHIVVSRTGGVGSIGVVTSHVDLSGAYEQAGIKVTFIASDPSKVEGNSSEPLSAGAKKRIQARIDELYEIFVAAVSRSRGIDADTIRGDLKAYCYTATQAVSNGLADSIGSMEDAHAAFAETLVDLTDNNGDEQMADNANSTVDQAVHEKAVEDARAEGHAAGLKEGATAAQTRISAILGSDEAKGREGLAEHFAFKTDTSAEGAIAALAASPKASVEPKKEDAKETPFDEAMKTDNPDVGATGGKKDDDNAEDVSGDILALIRSQNLPGFNAASGK